MKDTLANKLDSFNKTLAVTDAPQFKTLWFNNPPLAFTEEIAGAHTAVQALASDAAEQSVSILGNTESLQYLRIQFEQQLHLLARGTFRCLNAMGQKDNAAKVDFTPTDLHNARAVALAGMGETVLDLAEPLMVPQSDNQPAPGAKYISSALVSNMETLWQKYSATVGAAGSARAKRKAQTEQLPGKFAAVEEIFSGLDDLVVQFNGTPAGHQFVDAWFNARRVDDLGHRTTKATPIPVPTPSSLPQPAHA